MERKRIEEILKSCQGKKILVLGDIMVDEFLYGKVERISPEAPVPILEFSSHIFLPGGAANSANNIKSLGGEPILTGYIGDDFGAEKLLEELKKREISTDGLLVNKERPTILKTRVIAHTQQVVRIDREIRGEIDSDLERKITNFILWNLNEINAFLISDYNKGTVTKTILKKVIKEAKSKGKPIVADTKKLVLENFQGITILTPNVVEIERLANFPIRSESDLEKAARKVIAILNLEAVLVTRAEEGVSLFEKRGKPCHIPAISTQVHDVTGAGDTVAATLALTLASGATFQEAAFLANLAAGVVVRKIGTATCSPNEILILAKETGNC